MLRPFSKFFSTILLVPVATFFVFCCCLQVEAKSPGKSSCAACPKIPASSENKNHESCPHSQWKAVSDSGPFVFAFLKNFSPVLIVFDMGEQKSFFNNPISFLNRLTDSPIQPCLYFQNPILRV